ncbi:TRAP transporter large permease [Brevibacterium litoralis]|uniref:TRAP transporter large permease n=1 Tax=Brevibacterium litoralis TaxID=3138935 RepID=UPI0032EAD425
MIELLLFGSFFVLLALGVPVAFSLGAASILVLVVTDGLRVLDVVPSVIFPSMSSATLLAIPFFVLTGVIMQHTGISKRLVDLAFLVFGRFTHGMAFVTIAAAFFFSAISGSGPATVAAIGGILVPALVKDGFRPAHASSLVAASGSMGIIVPPSIAFIVFAVVAAEYERVSISRLFIAGVVPGILLGIAFLVAAMFLPRTRRSLAEVVAGAAVAGGGGSARRGRGDDTTPAPARATTRLLAQGAGAHPGAGATDATGGGAGSAGRLGGVATQRHGYRPEAGVGTAAIMFIVGVASLFSYVITVEHVTERVSTAVLGVTDNRFLVLLAATVLLLVVGAFVDAVSAFYLLVPVMVPVLLAVGVDITTIGVMMTVNLAIGLFTPPVGLNLFVAADFGKLRPEDMVRGVLPFFLAALVCLLLVTYVPWFSNWLPDLLGV